MSLTLLVWFVVFSSIAILALLVYPLRSRRLEAVGARPKLGNLNETEEDAAREALLSRLRSSRLGFGRDLRGSAGTLIAAAAGFLLVAGIGAVASYVGDSGETTVSGDTIPFPLSGSASNGEMLARLTDYARSIATELPAPVAATGEPLPDVTTMIERLAARLETTPEDIEGWRMLGWSYFHTALYEQAATAYARAIALDPGSAELKRLYEEAKAKASESDDSQTQTGVTR